MLPRLLLLRRGPSTHLRTLTTTTTTSATTSAPPPSNPPGSHRDLRRTFYVDAVVDKIMKHAFSHPHLTWTRARLDLYRVLRTQAGCGLLLQSKYLSHLRASMVEEEREGMKRFGTEKVCFGRTLEEHRRIKRDLYRLKFLSLMEAEETRRSDEVLGREVGALEKEGSFGENS